MISPRIEPSPSKGIGRGIVGAESDEMCELLHTLNASFLECGEHAVGTVKSYSRISIFFICDPGHSLDERILREQFGY
jgi:hypothetical protein